MRFIIVSIIVVGLCVAFVQAVLATNCGPYSAPSFDCVSVNDMESQSAVNTFVPLSSQTTLTYLSTAVVTTTEFCWNCLPSFSRTITTSANGVMQIDYPALEFVGDITTSPIQLRKRVTLTPGKYRLATRAATSPNSSGIELDVNLVLPGIDESIVSAMGQTTFGLGPRFDLGGIEWRETEDFTLLYTTEADLRVIVGNMNWDEYVLIDAIYIVKTVNFTAPTLPPGTPTPRPLATSLPAATPFCIGGSGTPTPTPPIGVFGTPVPTATPVVIATNEFAVIDVFAGGIGNQWQKMPGTLDSELRWSNQRNYTPYAYHEQEWGPDGGRTPGSALMYYSAVMSDVIDRPALVFSFANPPTSTVYLDGWGNAISLVAGQRAYVEVFKQEAGWLTFTQVTSYQVGAGAWYPFHTSITHAGGLQAIAIAVSRNDNARLSGVYLDDLYLYNTLSATPPCNSIYGVFISRQNAIDITGGNGTYSVVVNANKPCPTAHPQANNFFGPILGGITELLDGLFGLSDPHVAGSINGPFQDALLSPIGSMFFYLSILFDWGWVIEAVSWGLRMATFVMLIATIRAVKFTLPFL
jgi:hypothetical protein